MKKILIVCLISFVMTGCKTVRLTDIDAWRDVPVEALDTHSLFITIPVVKTLTDSGIEIRDYVNKRNIGNCFGGGQGTRNYAGGYMSYTN